MNGSFRPKTEMELGVQVSNAENVMGVPLRPPHSDLNVLKTSLKDLKELYPKRYEFYLEELRRQKRGGTLGEDEARRMRAWLGAMNSLDEYIHNHHEDIEGNTLTEHQITVFEAIHNFFEKGGSKGYIKLPTGSGKTVIFIEMIEAMNLKALVVLPRKVLLEQTVKRIEEFADDLDVGRVYSAAKEHGRKVTLITYDSFVSGVKAGLIDPKEFDLLVLDEVHRGLSDKRKETLGKFPHALQVGFTATPAFSDKKRVEQILPDCIFEMSIREAVEKRMLCSFISGVIQTNVDLSTVTIKDTGEYDAEELEKAVDIEARNRAAVNTYKEVAPSGKAVVYCAGIDHSKHVAERFVKEGIVAAAVWGAMPKNDLKTTLADFASGKIKALCNADLLVEGFDDKEVGLCINLRPTRSPVISEQRGGRVLRNDPKNPDKVAVIVDFLDRKGSTGLAGSVLFAEIAGSSIIEARVQKGRGRSGNQDSEEEKENDSEAQAAISQEFLVRLKKINLEDVQITFEVEEIVRIIQEKNEEIEKREKFLSYEEWAIQARMAGAKSTNYAELRKSHSDWPAAPAESYGDRWRGWQEVTGNIPNAEKIFLPYEDWISEVKLAGLKKSKDYPALRRKHADWPAAPNEAYKDQWRGWQEITGKISTATKEFPIFEIWLSQVKLAGIKTSAEYKEARKHHTQWPSNPEKIYPDNWRGWEMVTGTPSNFEKEFLSYDDWVIEVKKRGVQSSVDYYQISDKPLNWPSRPQEKYKDRWNGWRAVTDSYISRETEFLGYDEWVTQVRESGIKTMKQYDEIRKQRSKWPSRPRDQYKDQWKGWDVVVRGTIGK